MDGYYAVRYEDVKHCNELEPAVLEIVEEIPAGQHYAFIQPSAARILTGAIWRRHSSWRSEIKQDGRRNRMYLF